MTFKNKTSDWTKDMIRLVCLLSALLICNPGFAQDADQLFQTHCASCHNPDRLGAMGPALLPENLGRLKKTEAAKVIAQGRAATQMPAFAGKLSPEQIQSLVAYIYTPPSSMPVWDAAAIKQSHVVQYQPGSLPDKPVFDADPMNLFIVVELGDHHATPTSAGNHRIIMPRSWMATSCCQSTVSRRVSPYMVVQNIRPMAATCISLPVTAGSVSTIFTI